MHYSFTIWHLVATILIISLRLNLPDVNLEVRTLRSCLHLLHYFNTICPRPKTRHLASQLEGLGRDTGQWGKIRDVPGNTGRLATLGLMWDEFCGGTMYKPNNGKKGKLKWLKVRYLESDLHQKLIISLAACKEHLL